MRYLAPPDGQRRLPRLRAAVLLPARSRCRTTTSTACRRATRRAPSRRGSPTCRSPATTRTQRRLLRNEFPVQFPVPSPAFFPINVYRLNLVTDTEQHVRTPGLDVQATFVPARNHVLTAGLMVYSDGSQDTRTNTHADDDHRQRGAGRARAAGRRVPVARSCSGPPSVTHPVRVPDASFRDVGVFAQDEWDVTPRAAPRRRPARRSVPGRDRRRRPATTSQSLTGRRRTRRFRPATLPELRPATASSRAAVTGDIGARLPAERRAQPCSARYGRSYRHPNLEEMLFSGPATVGAIVPNMTVEPEMGNNVDVGLRLRAGRVAGVRVCTSTTRTTGSSRPRSCRRRRRARCRRPSTSADVRIQGVEAELDVPVVLRPGVLTFFGNAAFTRGTVLDGREPADRRVAGRHAAGQHHAVQRRSLGVRFNERATAGGSSTASATQAEVDARGADADRFAVPHPAGPARARAGSPCSAWPRASTSARAAAGSASSFAVENLADRYYREQFQFAPARGRSFTVALHVR